MMLTCTRCGRKHPMTEEDTALFYPRFFCLSCGERVPFPIDEAKVLTLRHSNNLDRRLTDLNGVAPEAVRKVWKGSGTGQETDGG